MRVETERGDVDSEEIDLTTSVLAIMACNVMKNQPSVLLLNSKSLPSRREPM